MSKIQLRISEVSLTTDSSTKLRGGDLAGLKADQRVTVRVKDGKALNVALPNAAATQQLMNSAVARGDGDKDHSALVRTLEALAGIES